MAQEIGSAKAIQGQVSAVGPEGARTLSVGSPVFKGDTLSTAKGSGGSIQFLDKTVLNVGEGSKVSLDQYVYDAGKGSGQALFKMAQGTFRAVTGEIVKQNPESFKMQSPLATIGIRGTETAHTVPGPGQGEGSETHLVMVFDGKPVIVQPLGGGAFQVLSQAGVKVEVGKFGAGPVMVMTPQEFKYFQALTATGLQQGVPQDTLSPQGQNNPVVQDAQNAANKATADAQAKAAEAAAAKAAAEAAAKAEAAAQAAALAAAQAQAEAFAAQQALALAKAAAEAKAAADAAAQAGQQATQLSLSPGSVISFSTSTDSSGNTTTIITVTPGAGGQGQGGATPIIVSEVAQDIITPPPPQQPDTIPGGNTPDTPTAKTLDLSAESYSAAVNLADAQPFYVLDQGSPVILEGTYANVIGTQFNDSILGNNSANNLQGLNGDDSISGMGGNDTIQGGSGSDSLYGGEGNDSILGGDGADLIDVGIGRDYADGGGGGDAFFLGTALNNTDGLDTILGGAGQDFLYFTDNGAGTNDLATTRGVEVVVLGDAPTNITFPANYTTADWSDIGGMLTINGGGLGSTSPLTFDGSAASASGTFVIIGGAGADKLTGGAGNDTITGGVGDDTLAGGAGDDELIGGVGNNTVSYAADSGSVTVILDDGCATDGGGGQDQLTDIQNVIGSDYADNITGNTGVNIIEGGKGADFLYGMGGNDIYVFREGDLDAQKNMTLAGGDTVRVYGNLDFTNDQAAITGAGTLEVAQAGSMVHFTTAQGASLATINFSTATSGSTEHVKFHAVAGTPDMNLAGVSISGASAGDKIYLYGDTQANNFTGSSIADVIYGGNGDDTLQGGAGNDDLNGDAGNDILTGGAGNDNLNGGAGLDTADYSAAVTALTISLVGGGATVNAGALGTDILTGIENLIGGSGDDNFTGDDAANLLSGMDGNDTLTGGAGNDTLLGGDGDDSLLGGAGDDTLSGGLGDDTIDGGTGFNTLHLSYGSLLTNVTNIDSVIVSAYNDNYYLDPIQPGQLVHGNATLYFDASAVTGDFTFVGTSMSNTGGLDFTGGTGADVIEGTHYADVLRGGGGDDNLRGDGGNDTIDGGEGNDTVFFGNTDTGVIVDLQAGTAIDGLGGTDTLISIENISGSFYADSIIGNTLANILKGDEGNDTINGGAGNDTINGGGGADVLTGGDGADTFFYSSSDDFGDSITDYVFNTDFFSFSFEGGFGWSNTAELQSRLFDDIGSVTGSDACLYLDGGNLWYASDATDVASTSSLVAQGVTALNAAHVNMA